LKADYEIHIANKIRAIAIRFRALCIEVRAEVAILVVKASAEPERVGYTTYREGSGAFFIIMLPFF